MDFEGLEPEYIQEFTLEYCGGMSLCLSTTDEDFAVAATTQMEADEPAFFSHGQNSKGHFFVFNDVNWDWDGVESEEELRDFCREFKLPFPKNFSMFWSSMAQKKLPKVPVTLCVDLVPKLFSVDDVSDILEDAVEGQNSHRWEGEIIKEIQDRASEGCLNPEPVRRAPSTEVSMNITSSVLEANELETSVLNDTFESNYLGEDKLLNELFGSEVPSLTEQHSNDANAALPFDTSSDSNNTAPRENQTNSNSGTDFDLEKSNMDLTSTPVNRVDDSLNVDHTTGSNIYDPDLPVFELTDEGLVPVVAAAATDLEALAQEQAVDDIFDDESEEIVTEIVDEEIRDNFVVNMELRTPAAAARGRVKDRNIQPAAPLKKVKNASLWKVNDAKVKRHLGLPYKSKEGKEYSAKTMRPSCGVSCKYKCDTRVTEEDREYFKDRYYTKNENQTKKWLFILSFVKSKPVERPKEDDVIDNGLEPRTPQKKHSRSCHNEYYMELKGGNKVKVCKDMFKSTLVISDSTIATALKKRGSPEKRGKSGVKRIIPAEVINSIHDHIRKFPRVESHYCRKDTTYEYLEEAVDSVANMYRFYVEWMDINHVGKQKATLRQYTDQFNTLKIKIFQPRKDLCDHCFSYENIPDEQRTPEVVECHQAHILQKDLAKSLYAEDREAFLKDPTVAVSSFDMEKTHLLPQCRAGEVYYSRKLNVNNFTIKEVRTAQGYCYVWDESIAKRGANEVASFLHSYLEERSKEGVKTFHFWSDNCGPQNKNRYLYGMYMSAVAKFEIKIVHKYLMKGHTSNDADGMHSLIERKTSKMDLYVPEDWYSAIENVKKTGKKYIVKRTKTEDIKNYHDFVDNKSVWHKDENGSIVRWSEIVDISISNEDPWKLLFKYHHGDEYTPVIIRKKTVGRPVNLKTYEPTCAYSKPPTLDVLKKKELLALCQSLIVPLRAHDFYESLVSSNDAP
ncbi:hypothetical protein FOCC_FOCC013920 [Frankliniella occidentalis]|nr:hypothetical protein FOCC_FOCC013920 [Frankliniella occidentalis]